MGVSIAFSGQQNTGKSTIINTIKNKLEDLGLSVVVKGEVARELMETIDPKEDMSLFQEEISSKEYIRAYHLEKEVADVILIDRTFMDNLAYFVYNVMTGKVSGQTKISIPDIDPYDKVVYFDTPIKETTTDMFQHYDDERLRAIMGSLVKSRFEVEEFRNGMVDEEAIISYIVDYAQNRMRSES